MADDDPVVTAARANSGSPAYVGRFRMVPAPANRQPAAAAYVRRPGDAEHRPFAIGVLRITGDRIAEMTAFHDPGLFPAFALPATLPPRDRPGRGQGRRRRQMA